jgi:hypothetical protein
MVPGVPINRRSNIVVLETGKCRLTLSEVGRNWIVLPVNDTIQLYQDGKWFVVLDSKKKKHRFGLIHMEDIQNEPRPATSRGGLFCCERLHERP